MEFSFFSIIEKIAIYQISVFLNNTNDTIFKTKYQAFLIPDANEKGLKEIKDGFYEYIDVNDDISSKRYRRIISTFNIDDEAEMLFILCLAKLICPEFSRMITDIAKSYGDNDLNIGLCLKMLRIKEDSTVDFIAYEDIFKSLKNILIYKLEYIPFFKYSLMADERIMGYLNGSDEIDKNIKPFSELVSCDIPLQEMYCGEKYEQTLEMFVKLQLETEKSKPLIQIMGAEGNGKKLFLSHACHKNNIPLITVDCKELLKFENNVIMGMIRYIKREALLAGALVAFCNVNSENFKNESDINKFKSLCCSSLLDDDIKIAILSDQKFKLSSYFDNIVLGVTVENYSRTEQVALWKKYKEQFMIKTKIDENDLSNRFKLSALEIKKAVSYILISEKSNEKIDLSTISKICYKCMAPINHGNVKHVKSSYTLDDLKLPKDQKTVLQNICNHVVYRNKVFDSWGMDKKYAYGKGISALFVGPPGTGKTMAANVLSGMLSLELYRVDISQIVDKYIGETEKKLEEIFSIAENSNMILFFDEADAIFGKRSEVTEAKDRFANTETSYILQRIEDYDGIVILASNYKKNIDEAFMRRIRYLIEFQLPNAEIRKDIWKSCFSKNVPLDDIDFDYLSTQFELSGGSIKNIVLNATFLAAAENKSVEMHHILESVKNENIKLSKVMLKQDFGAYSHMM